MTDKRTWVEPTAERRRELLRSTRSIAIVGMSDKPTRPSYGVAAYLQESSSYTLYFVNPLLAAEGKEVLGQKVYASPADLPQAPDMVDIFRRSEDLPGTVQEAADAGARSVWIQLGLWNEDAARLAQDAGLDVVMDRCIKIEHEALL